MFECFFQNCVLRHEGTLVIIKRIRPLSASDKVLIKSVSISNQFLNIANSYNIDTLSGIGSVLIRT